MITNWDLEQMYQETMRLAEEVLGPEKKKSTKVEDLAALRPGSFVEMDKMMQDRFGIEHLIEQKYHERKAVQTLREASLQSQRASEALRLAAARQRQQDYIRAIDIATESRRALVGQNPYLCFGGQQQGFGSAYSLGCEHRHLRWSQPDPFQTMRYGYCPECLAHVRVFDPSLPY